MKKEEEIKNLLLELNNNPNKILELERYSENDVIKVAFKNGLYEPLMITFQPITIGGEVRICFDAFSTDILRILQRSCDTKEHAEQEARQQYEKIQESNSKLSEEDMITYEEILNSIIVVPKEIKAAFEKILFTINYEQISKMKIKNCHARQISGWSHPVETVKDVMVYSELPCLMASIDLFNKNIRTSMNDTEGVLEDQPFISNGTCQIWFKYGPLSQENKAIVEELIASGCAKKFMDANFETISIFVPCSGEETVGEVSDKLRAIVSRFNIQDIGYGKTIEEIYQDCAPILQRYPSYAEGLFDNGTNISDLIELGKRLGRNLYYAEEEGLIWETPELYQRHRNYVDAQPTKSPHKK